MSLYNSNYIKSSVSKEQVLYYDLEELIPEFFEEEQEEIELRQETEGADEIKGPSEADIAEQQKNLDNLRAQADEIIAQAKAKAEEIIEKAKSEAALILEDSYKEGREKGEKEGYAEGVKIARQEAQELIDARMKEVSSLSKAIISEKERFINDQRNIIIELSARMAGKILNGKLSSDEETLLNMFEYAVKDMAPAKKLTITVSHKDYEIMVDNTDRIKEIAREFEDIEIRCEETASRGVLKLDTPYVTVDASVEKQIGILKTELSKVAF